MRIMCELIRYQYKQYKLSAKWVMPCAGLLAAYATMYYVAPVGVVSVFSMMGLFLFCIMVWIGVTNQDVEPEVSEQVMILRLQSERKYYLCHIIFLAGICVWITLLSMLVPILKHILLGNSFFDRSLIWSDIIGGFLIMFACSFVGAMVGELFHTRIVKKREYAIGATVFVALVAVTRNGIIADYSFAKYILWVIPPVSDVVSWFSNEVYFDMMKLLGGFGLLLAYGIIQAIVKVELLCRKKF